MSSCADARDAPTCTLIGRQMAAASGCTLLWPQFQLYHLKDTRMARASRALAAAPSYSLELQYQRPARSESSSAFQENPKAGAGATSKYRALCNAFIIDSVLSRPLDAMTIRQVSQVIQRHLYRSRLRVYNDRDNAAHLLAKCDGHSNSTSQLLMPASAWRLPLTTSITERRHRSQHTEVISMRAF
nr:hypothetical protein CFP56_24305 [Quercus suber]